MTKRWAVAEKSPCEGYSAPLWSLLALDPLFDFLDEVRRRNVKCAAEAEHHADARAVSSELHQRNVVPVHIRAQGEIGLAPFTFRTQAA